MENMNKNQKTNRPDRMGTNNPMWGRHHSEITKRKQRDAAIKRNQEYKKAMEAQHHLSMDEFLSSNPSVEEHIKTLVREEIDRFISSECKKQSRPLNIWL